MKEIMQVHAFLYACVHIVLVEQMLDLLKVNILDKVSDCRNCFENTS